MWTLSKKLFIVKPQNCGKSKIFLNVYGMFKDQGEQVIAFFKFF